MEALQLEIADPRWREVLGRIAYDFYHLPEYSELECATTAAQPQAFWCGDGDREVFLPYLLRRCASLFPESPLAERTRDAVSPYGYPGLLLSDAARQSPEFVQKAMQLLGETLRAQGVCSAFFRMNPLLSEGFAELFPANFFSAPSETVGIDLTLDSAVIWKNVRDGHQWVIKKCRKLGYQPRMVPFSENIEAFMDVYKETMDRVQARDSYYFGREYFEKLAAMPESVHCCIVDFEGTPAAACVFFECGGIVQAHLGGTKSEFLSKSPFHLALYHAMEWAKERGNRYFHLGGGVGGTDDRLLNFKRGFSDLTFPFFTLRMIADEENYRALTALSAQAAGVPLEDRLRGDYFPAYRTPI
ncbi:MAG: GNAT family N-acetyltransferase [Chthoniobacter sp.]|nr:GNAT family N-acetyltransferase [Chthoniobacter sp.]